MNKESKRLITVIFALAVALMLFSRLLDNWLVPTLQAGLAAIGPFLLGFVIAYLLRFAVNPLQRLLKRITKAKGEAKWARTLAIVISVTLFVGIIIALCVIVFPQLYQNIVRLVQALPGYLEDIYSFIKDTADRLSIVIPENSSEMLLGLKQSLIDFINNNSADIITYAGNLLLSIGSAVFDFFIAMVVAIYLLADSSRYKHLTKRAMRSIMPNDKSYANLLDFVREADLVMGRYVSGKLLQTLLLTLAACIGFAIAGMDYFLLLGVLVGILNLVPYIGPWIAAVPAVVLALLESPVTALWVIIILVALQLLDNFLLGPYILGEKLKISPLWIFVGIIVGGAMFGLPGMLLGAPAVAILSGLVEKFIEYREKSKARATEDEKADAQEQ
ncbi:MAG: AI-2E family transporter [Clostridia bacterium]|nr:AI-2E family transporter [Clostridia bacterium]